MSRGTNCRHCLLSTAWLISALFCAGTAAVERGESVPAGKTPLSLRVGSGASFTEVRRDAGETVDLGGPRGGDDAAWINEEIRKGMAEGKTSFRLREGQYTALSPIKIGIGIQRLSIEGAGSEKTVFRTPKHFAGHLFSIGGNIQSHNNWGLTNLKNRKLIPAAEGDRKLVLEEGEENIAVGDYVIWDLQRAFNQNNFGVYNGAEIVTVVSYDPATRTATIDVPLGRDFKTTPMLGDVRANLCRNITLAGIGFDGRTDPEEKEWVAGLVSATLVSDMRLDDLHIRNFKHGAVVLTVCRYAHLSRIVVENPQEAKIGTGYPVLMHRCRWLLVEDSRAPTFMTHGGTMDALFRRNCGRVDAHGMGERRLTIKDATGRSVISFGNDAWKSGGDGLTIDNCNVSNLYLMGDSRHIKATNSTISVLTISGGRQKTPVTDVVLDHVVIDRVGGGGSGFLRDGGHTSTEPHGPILIKNSKISDMTSAWPRILTLTSPFCAKLTFENCDFESPDKPNATFPIINITKMNRPMELTVRGCRFTSFGTTAIWIDKESIGTYLFENNIFFAPKASSIFLRNESTDAKVVDRNNQVSVRKGMKMQESANDQ